MEIYKNNWDTLSILEINEAFKSFGNITMMPSDIIVKKIMTFGTATLELLENRTESTLFRFRQLDLVYHVFENQTREYTSFQQYQNTRIEDELIKSFEKKAVVFKFIENQDKIIVEYLKYPRFIAEYSTDKEAVIKVTNWIDADPNDASVNHKLLKKAFLFMKNYLPRH